MSSAEKYYTNLSFYQHQFASYY